MQRAARALLLVAFACVASEPASAQVSGHVALVSDYRWRGLSLTDGSPALQGSLSYDHSSGLFAGLFGSNVELRPGASGLALQAFGGYARRWRDDAAWDVGVVGYKFPRSARGRSYDYLEGFAGLTVHQFGARLYVSNNYYGAGDRSIYGTASLGLPLGPRLTLGLNAGLLQLWTRDSGARADTTRLDGRIGLTAEAAGFTWELSLIAADTKGCARGVCDLGIVAGVSRGF